MTPKLLAGSLLLALIANRALSQNAQPIGLVAPNAQPISEVAMLAVPPLDREAIAAEDTRRRANGDPGRYAIPSQVSATTDHDGTWQELDATWSLWRVRVNAPGANHVNLGFTVCQLPPTARLMVYAANYSHVVRPFRAADVTSGELWTPVVPGEEVVVELYLHTAQKPNLRVTLGQVGSGYRFFGAGSSAVQIPGTDDYCDIDVACPQSAGWLQQIRGVGKISIGGTDICTGSMLNNTAQDGRCFFLTAHHCGITAANAAGIVVYWNYQNAACGAAAGAGLAEFSTGATLRASYAPTDFTLLELTATPNPEWGVSYLGWERVCDCTASAVTVHHGGGDPKMITFENNPVQVPSSYSGTTSPGDRTHIRVVDWDAGSTQGGASGAPLFNDNHRVIGQLHGGAAACGNDSSDWFGRFSVSWKGGDTLGTRLSDWLDPGNTKAAAVNTYGQAAYRTFASGCAGSMSATQLSALVPPATGTTLFVGLNNLPDNAAIMITGLSRTLSASVPLPIPLDVIGMPGCTQYVSLDILNFVAGSGTQGTFSMALAADPTLTGVRFFQQAYVFDLNAGNPAGAVMSDTAGAVIDNLPGGIAGGVVPEMVTISPGTFVMGSNAPLTNEYGLSTSRAWELPLHSVTITRPFCIGKYEVTQAEFLAVMGYNPSWCQPPNFPANTQRPVDLYNVTDIHGTAMAYCAALNAQEEAAGRLPTGYQYRLPTEAEWEYCCRAGSTTEYHYGDHLLCGQARISMWYPLPTTSANCPGWPSGFTYPTLPVGSFLANAWGLHDMHSNVNEWVLDKFSLAPNYPATAVVDPYVSVGSHNINRGGSAIDGGSGIWRSANRGYFGAGLHGLRVVLGPVLVAYP